MTSCSIDKTAVIRTSVGENASPSSLRPTFLRETLLSWEASPWLPCSAHLSCPSEEEVLKPLSVDRKVVAESRNR